MLVTLRKLLCASNSARVSPCWYLHAGDSAQATLRKLTKSSWHLHAGDSVQATLRKLTKSSARKNPSQCFRTIGPKAFFPRSSSAAETPFYIAAARVSSRGDAQCVWSHESSISSSYERKHGSARSHIFTSVNKRRLKRVRLETNYKQKQKQTIAKLTRRPQFLQSTLAQLSSVQDGSAQLGSVKVGSTQATFREWLCATGSVQVGSARACLAQCALHDLRRAISRESGLRKLHCSRLLRASCSLQAAARKCSVQVALRKCSEQVALRKCSAPVAPCKRFAHVLCASWSVKVALRKCFVQVLCASCCAQVALRK